MKDKVIKPMCTLFRQSIFGGFINLHMVRQFLAIEHKREKHCTVWLICCLKCVVIEILLCLITLFILAFSVVLEISKFSLNEEISGTQN